MYKLWQTIVVAVSVMAWGAAECAAEEALTADKIQGVWYYVRLEKTKTITGAAEWDVIEFGGKQTVKVRGSAEDEGAVGQFSVKDQTISLRFAPPAINKEVAVQLIGELRDGGELVLMPKDKEWACAYIKKDRLLSEDILGKWATQSEAQTVIREFQKDGVYRNWVEGSKLPGIDGRYRLWRGKNGKMLTIVWSCRIVRAVTDVFAYERKGQELRMFDVNNDGNVTTNSVVYRLSR